MSVQLYENAIGLLKTNLAVNMQNSAAQALYTVPTGKKCVVTHVVIRTCSVTFTGSAVNKFGFNSTAYDNWKSLTTELATMTTADAIVITNTAKFVIGVAADVFKIIIATGVTAAATATIDVFGFLYDA